MQKVKTVRLPLGGSAIGAINGLLGGGGGMVAVPLLKGCSYSTKEAHATAIAVILPASVFSGIIYLLHGFVPLNVFLPTALGVSAGGYLGARLLARFSPQKITLLFALVMLAAGVRMLF